MSVVPIRAWRVTITAATVTHRFYSDRDHALPVFHGAVFVTDFQKAELCWFSKEDDSWRVVRRATCNGMPVRRLKKSERVRREEA